MFSLRGNYDVCTFLHGIWYYLQVTPLGTSLYNSGTRLCSQRTTSSCSKYREGGGLLLTMDMRENKTNK